MTTGAPPLRAKIVKLHRWLGLAAAAFWLLQAITGTMIVFHWEIRDAAISDLHRPTDPAGIERRLTIFAPPGTKATLDSMWTTAGLPDRYDVYFTDAAGESRSARIAGDGTILRGVEEPSGGILDTAVGLHHNLLADTTGDWIVGITGLLLVTNLIAGLMVAWPRNVPWKSVVKPINRGPVAARLFSWHRAIGLWLVLPALVLVVTGTFLKFPDGVSKLVGADTPSLPPVPARGAPVGVGRAIETAFAALPGSTLVSVGFPTAEDATYTIRLQTPQEMLRPYGASRVLVDANDGRVRGSFPIVEASFATRAFNALVPIHTGRVAGLGGRLLTFTIGIWLIAMIITGLLLWQRRRKKRTSA